MKVLILDEDYRQYQQLLLAQGVAADAGCDPTVFPADYDALLAQPDLAAQYLEQGGQTPWVQSTWAGVDTLVTAAGAAGVVVTGVKDIFV